MKFLLSALLFLTAVYVSESHILVRRDVTTGMPTTGNPTTSKVDEMRAAYHKELLLKAVTALYDNTKTAIMKLNEAGKKDLVDGLDEVIKVVKKMTEKITDLKPTTTMGESVQKLFEKLSKMVGDVMQDDLDKVQAKYSEEDKQALMLVAGTVYDEFNAALENDQKLSKDLSKTIDFVKDIEKVLDDLKGKNHLGKTIDEGFAKVASTIHAFLKEDEKIIDH